MSVDSHPRRAFVTLLTSASYLPGALVLAHALDDLHPKRRGQDGGEAEDAFETACLVTPETVDVATIKHLRKAFDRVIGVEVIGSGEAGQEGLGLMGRPDLDNALTKLHIFRLGALYDRVVYLDADVLPLRPLSQLFRLPNRFSACPDTGWPDCFNSGVMALQPDERDFEGMREIMREASSAGRAVGASAGGSGSGNGSFDGADQGLLNEWFSEEGGGGDWNRLSFTYNVTPSAAYTYAPAYKRYGSKIHAVHFIGSSKPWKSISTRPARAPVPSKDGVFDYPSLVDRWFAVYDKHIRPMDGFSAAAPTFSVPTTTAAWDSAEPALATHQGRMDLEALKQAAERGVSVFMGAGNTEGKNEDGIYDSLPLDGRVDLMRPKPPSPKPVSPERLPAPSLAASPPVYAQALPAPLPIHPPARQGSPPIATWDAQHSAPPLNLGPEMASGMHNFYQNAWDRDSPEATELEPWNPAMGYPTIPDNVRNNDWYAGAADVAPDRANVKHVFPWEEGKRAAPSRVFPKGDSPPPEPRAETPAVAVQAPSPPLVSPVHTPQPLAPAPPPVRGFAEAMASYTNAWDEIPAIQRYFSRMTATRSPLLSRNNSASMTPTLENPHGINRDGPLASAASGSSRPKGSKGSNDGLDTKSEASHDGDDEDETDDSAERDESPEIDRRPPGGAGGAAGGNGSGISRPGHAKRYSESHGRANRDAGGAGQNGSAGGSKQHKASQTSPPGGSKAQGDTTETAPSRPIGARPRGARTGGSTSSSRSGTDTGRGSPPVRAPPRPIGVTDRTESSETVTSASSHQITTPNLDTPTGEQDGSPPNGKTGTHSPPIARVFDPSTSIDSRRRDTVEVLTRFIRQSGQPTGAR